MALVDHLRLMTRYGAWANRRLFDACHALDPGAYYADRGAFFGSIHGTLNHILVADRLWLGRVTGVAPPIAALDQILYDDLDALWEARQVEDGRIAALADGLDEAAAARVLSYQTMAGDRMRTPLSLVLTHMVNHATHHRGQAHGLLSQVPAEPPPLDLMVYLREAG